MYTTSKSIRSISVCFDDVRQVFQRDPPLTTKPKFLQYHTTLSFAKNETSLLAEIMKPSLLKNGWCHVIPENVFGPIFANKLWRDAFLRSASFSTQISFLQEKYFVDCRIAAFCRQHCGQMPAASILLERMIFIRKTLQFVTIVSIHTFAPNKVNELATSASFGILQAVIF